jgi:membrane protein implicated in regulation of membrane protease activity
MLALIALMLGAVWLPYTAEALLPVQLILFAIAGGVYVVYPKNKEQKGRSGWALRKKLEGVTLTCGFLLLLFTGPALRDDRISFGATPAYAVSVSPPLHKEQTKVGRFLKSLKKKYIDTPHAVKLLLALLAFAVAVFAGFGIVSLACDLSCSGYETAAAFVGLGGGTILIVGLVLAFSRIFENKEQAAQRRARRIQRMKKES